MVKRTVSGSFLIGLAVVMLGCPTSVPDPDDKPDSEAETYSVTYNGNGNDTGDVPSDSKEYEEGAEVIVLDNTGGSVPVDSTPYREGDTVTVLGNIGDLVKTNTFFVGWNPSAGGYDQTYHAEETFNIGTEDVELFARWAGQERILAFDGADQDDFGCSVSISGDYAVSGAPEDDDMKDTYHLFYAVFWGVFS